MRNMKAICIKLTCFLLVLFMSSAAMAESITSPNGQLQLNFSVNSQGEPVYELFYKGKAVIKPSKLGIGQSKSVHQSRIILQFQTQL